MSKPVPEPIEPGQVYDLATAVVKADRFPHLASIDGDRPRVRPVSPVRTDGFTVYVANLKGYHKTAEIAANPHVDSATWTTITTRSGSPELPRS